MGASAGKGGPGSAAGRHETVDRCAPHGLPIAAKWARRHPPTVWPKCHLPHRRGKASWSRLCLLEIGIPPRDEACAPASSPAPVHGLQVRVVTQDTAMAIVDGRDARAQITITFIYGLPTPRPQYIGESDAGGACRRCIGGKHGRGFPILSAAASSERPSRANSIATKVEDARGSSAHPQGRRRGTARGETFLVQQHHDASALKAMSDAIRAEAAREVHANLPLRLWGEGRVGAEACGEMEPPLP